MQMVESGRSKGLAGMKVGPGAESAVTLISRNREKEPRSQLKLEEGLPAWPHQQVAEGLWGN